MNPTLKQSLKTKAHHLKPVILMGAKGLTEPVILETDIALEAHELIKIKMSGVEKEDKKAVAEEICQRLNAEVIQQIGNTVTIYRRKKSS